MIMMKTVAQGVNMQTDSMLHLGRSSEKVLYPFLTSLLYRESSLP